MANYRPLLAELVYESADTHRTVRITDRKQTFQQTDNTFPVI
jgi:hypothetical protein